MEFAWRLTSILVWPFVLVTRATMSYPGSDTTTQARGRVEASDATAAGVVTLVWSELGYERRGRRAITFGGQYRAVVSGTTMEGAWYRGERPVGTFHLKATDGS